MNDKQQKFYKLLKEIRGGLSYGMSIDDICEKHSVSYNHIVDQLMKGIEIEREHSNDIKLNKKIALDHLVEDPDYYTKLQKIEEKTPCWDGYERVPNTKVGEKGSCRKKKKSKIVDESSSKCTKVTKKASSDRKGKKWTKCAKQVDGSIKRIHWGQKGVKVTGKSGNTKRKKSFRARHDCKNAKKGSPQQAACNDW
jgi:hypothetical protein